VSRDGKKRVAGEEWIVSTSGAYLPGVYEEVVDLVSAIVLTDKVALHLKALRTFTDVYGKVRKNGEEWLVTSKEAESHIPEGFFPPFLISFFFFFFFFHCRLAPLQDPFFSSIFHFSFFNFHFS